MMLVKFDMTDTEIAVLVWCLQRAISPKPVPAQERQQFLPTCSELHKRLALHISQRPSAYPADDYVFKFRNTEEIMQFLHGVVTKAAGTAEQQLADLRRYRDGLQLVVDYQKGELETLTEQQIILMGAALSRHAAENAVDAAGSRGHSA